MALLYYHSWHSRLRVFKADEACDACIERPQLQSCALRGQLVPVFGGYDYGELGATEQGRYDRPGETSLLRKGVF